MPVLINPFRNTIVKKPRDIEPPVGGLNQNQLDKILEEFEILLSDPMRHPDKAVFLTSAQAGYGKSHLLGCLFRKLSTRATLVYVRPFQDPNSVWQSILSKTIQELNFPDRVVTSGPRSTWGPSQLETISHGIIIDIVVKAINSKKINAKNPKKIIINMQKYTIEEFRNKDYYNKFKTHINNLMKQFREETIVLNASIESWLNVLLIYAYEPDHPHRQACEDWLKGGSIDEEEAEYIGIRKADRVHFDQSIQHTNKICKQRLRDLCELCRPVRPFLFCFDETERYLEEDLAKSFALVIHTLVEDVPNHLTVITANKEPWTQLASFWQVAQLHRLSPMIELDGINLAQSTELINNRLTDLCLYEEWNEKLLADNWLNMVYEKRQKMGIRSLLDKCRRRWDEINVVPKEEDTTTEETIIDKDGIEEYYFSLVEAVKSDPRRRVFDRDALRWLIEDVPAGLDGLTIEKYTGQKPYLVLKWQWGNRYFYFGFEDGLHWRRWQAIAEDARRHYTGNEKAKSIFLRTEDLKKIPPSGWKIAEDIREAKRECLHIIHLDFEMTCRLYAARDLYNEAVEGDIPFGAEEAVSFIQKELYDFWSLLKEPLNNKQAEPANDRTADQPPNDPPPDLIKRIRTIMAREKMMAFQELFERVKKRWPQIDEAMVRSEVGQLPEIKQHHSPNMTVLICR